MTNTEPLMTLIRLEEWLRLNAVAKAAKTLVESVEPSLDPHHELVSESALTYLEATLEAAGYGMDEASERDEPDEPDGECFRGGEAAAFERDEQARIQRELK